MADLVSIHGRVMDRFGTLVHDVGPDDWSRSTPCSAWDVTALVAHLVEEQRWVPGLLAGRPLDEAGQGISPDPGPDPAAAWDAASATAREAVTAPGALDGTVNLSRGPAPASEYVGEMTFDLLVHGWDLARALGRDESLDPEGVQVALAVIEPQADMLVATGLFGPAVPVPADADPQTRLLAVSGRRP